MGSISKQFLLRFSLEILLFPDVLIVNAENAAAGFGLTKKIANQLLDAGVDAITLGNHAWDQKEF